MVWQPTEQLHLRGPVFIHWNDAWGLGFKVRLGSFSLEFQGFIESLHELSEFRGLWAVLKWRIQMAAAWWGLFGASSGTWNPQIPLEGPLSKYVVAGSPWVEFGLGALGFGFGLSSGIRPLKKPI